VKTLEIARQIDLETGLAFRNMTSVGQIGSSHTGGWETGDKAHLAGTADK
jgi:hypothetical protein